MTPVIDLPPSQQSETLLNPFTLDAFLCFIAVDDFMVFSDLPSSLKNQRIVFVIGSLHPKEEPVFLIRLPFAREPQYTHFRNATLIFGGYGKPDLIFLSDDNESTK